MSSRPTPSDLPRLVVLAAAATFGAILARSLADRLGRRVPSFRRRGHAAYSPRADAEAAGGVRPAGAEAMRDPPRRWTDADEASDESFPASDPPANY